MAFWVDDVPFPKAGYISSLEGNFLSLLFCHMPFSDICLSFHQLKVLFEHRMSDISHVLGLHVQYMYILIVCITCFFTIRHRVRAHPRLGVASNTDFMWLRFQTSSVFPGAAHLVHHLLATGSAGWEWRWCRDVEPVVCWMMTVGFCIYIYK